MVRGPLHTSHLVRCNSRLQRTIGGDHTKVSDSALEELTCHDRLVRSAPNEVGQQDPQMCQSLGPRDAFNRVPLNASASRWDLGATHDLDKLLWPNPHSLASSADPLHLVRDSGVPFPPRESDDDRHGHVMARPSTDLVPKSRQRTVLRHHTSRLHARQHVCMVLHARPSSSGDVWVKLLPVAVVPGGNSMMRKHRSFVTVECEVTQLASPRKLGGVKVRGPATNRMLGSPATPAILDVRGSHPVCVAGMRSLRSAETTRSRSEVRANLDLARERAKRASPSDHAIPLLIRGQPSPKVLSTDPGRRLDLISVRVQVVIVMIGATLCADAIAGL